MDITSFDDILEAMEAVHGIDPAYGCARPGIIVQHGSRIAQHDFEFLPKGGSAVVRFDVATVEGRAGEVRRNAE